MIDINASIGEWPFGPLHNNTASGLLRWMDHLGIERACVAPLEALFYHDAQEANRALYRSLRRYRDRLLMFAVLNPGAPGWRTDLTACCDSFSVDGIRLFPSHHGYLLDDQRCEELLSELEQLGLPTQIAPEVSDTRMQHPKALVLPVSLEPLPGLLAKFPSLRIALLNTCSQVPVLSDIAPLKQTSNFFIDIAWADGVCCVEEVARLYGRDTVLFGTNAPLMYPHSAVLKLREAALPEDLLKTITQVNPDRFLGANSTRR